MKWMFCMHIYQLKQNLVIYHYKQTIAHWAIEKHGNINTSI